MRNLRKESVNRIAIIAVIMVSLLAGGGVLILKNTKTPARETAGDVRADAGGREAVVDPQIANSPAELSLGQKLEVSL